MLQNSNIGAFNRLCCSCQRWLPPKTWSRFHTLGKVYVSHIVNYLRHTTSRSSEDSGLEELCNMLDPERKDVSIDLDTYHAVMKEWIDDCRNSRYWENGVLL